jgi:hypothetical protein
MSKPKGLFADVKQPPAVEPKQERGKPPVKRKADLKGPRPPFALLSNMVYAIPDQKPSCQQPCSIGLGLNTWEVSRGLHSSPPPF